jgi:hypothetical protein
MKSYWEHVEEHIDNLKNILQTQRELNGNNKNPTPPSSLKIIKTWATWVHATSPHWLQYFFSLLMFFTIFGLS